MAIATQTSRLCRKMFPQTLHLLTDDAQRCIAARIPRQRSIGTAEIRMQLDHTGRIAERGSYTDLLAMNGVFAEMWRKQQEAAARGIQVEDIVPAEPAE